MNPIARRLMDVVRVTFARETLGAAPAEDQGPRPAATLLRRLFAIEPLPRDPVPPAPSTARSTLSWIFRPEPLPRDPEPPRVRSVGVLGAIFFHERLGDPPQED